MTARLFSRDDDFGLVIGNTDITIGVAAREGERFPTSATVKIIPTKKKEFLHSQNHQNPFLFIMIFAIVVTSISILISFAIFMIVKIRKVKTEVHPRVPYNAFNEN